MASVPIHQIEVTGPIIPKACRNQGTIGVVMLTSGDVDSELGRRAMPTSICYTTWLLGIHDEGDGMKCSPPRLHSHLKCWCQ